MPTLAHDVPQINQTTFAHLMTSAMAVYLDAIAIGNTSIGRDSLVLAQDTAARAVRSSLYGTGERESAQAFAELLDKVVLV